MMITLRTSLTGVFLVSANCGGGPGWTLVLPNGSYGSRIPPAAHRSRLVAADVLTGIGPLEEHRAGAARRTRGVDDEGIDLGGVVRVRQDEEIGLRAVKELTVRCQRDLGAMGGLEDTRRDRRGRGRRLPGVS